MNQPVRHCIQTRDSGSPGIEPASVERRHAIREVYATTSSRGSAASSHLPSAPRFRWLDETIDPLAADTMRI